MRWLPSSRASRAGSGDAEPTLREALTQLRAAYLEVKNRQP